MIRNLFLLYLYSKIEKSSEINLFIENSENENPLINYESIFDNFIQIPKYEGYKIVKIMGSGSYGIVFYICFIDKMITLDPHSILSVKFEFGILSGTMSTEIEAYKKINANKINDPYIKKYFLNIFDQGYAKCTNKELVILRKKSFCDIEKEINQYGHFDSENLDKVWYTIMEIAECDLQHLINTARNANPTKNFEEKNIIYMLNCIANALLILKKLKMVHRDIKPGNILIFHEFPDNELVFKLCDFSLCYIYEDKFGSIINNNINVGTKGFKAPEILPGSGIEIDDLYKTDIFSLGLCALSMSFLDAHIGSKDLTDKEIKEILDINISNISLKLKKLLKKMLNFNPIERISIEELVEKIKKFENYDNQIHLDISVMLINKKVNFKVDNPQSKLNNMPSYRNAPDFINGSELLDLYTGVYNGELRIQWIFNTIFMLQKADPPTVKQIIREIELSNDDMKLNFLGMLYLLKFDNKIMISHDNARSIYIKLANSKFKPIRELSSIILEILDSLPRKLEENNILNDYEINFILPFLSRVSDRQIIIGLINQCVGFLSGNILASIYNFKNRPGSICGPIEYSSFAAAKDLPTLKNWMENGSDYSEKVIYVRKRSKEIIFLDLLPTAIIRYFNPHNSIQQKLLSVHKLLEEYSNTHKKYFQKMISGKICFMIKSKKYTIKNIYDFKRLFQIILNLDQIYALLIDITEALYILQYKLPNKIAHLNVHPNAIQTNNKLKFRLCNFEYAYIFPASERNTIPMLSIDQINKDRKLYTAPEIIKQNGKEYDPFKASIYSLGVIIIQVLMESFKPFENPMNELDKLEKYHKLSKDYRFKKIVYTVRLMVQEDIEKRPDLKEMMKILDSPFAESLSNIPKIPINLIYPKLKKYNNNNNNNMFLIEESDHKTLFQLIESRISNKCVKFSNLEMISALSKLTKCLLIYQTEVRMALRNITPHTIKCNTRGYFGMPDFKHSYIFAENEKIALNLNEDSKRLFMPIEAYIDPEISKHLYQGKQNDVIMYDPFKNDIYSLGVSMLQMIQTSLEPPSFPLETVKNLINSARGGFDKQALGILEQMLETPDNRIDITTLDSCLACFT